MKQKYIVAIEIGSSKIKGAVGALDENGTLSVLAVEEEKQIDSVRYGCVQNVNMVRNSIIPIVRKLENQISPLKINGMYVALGGRSMMSCPREVTRQLPDAVEINERIVEQINEDAKKTILSDKDVIDIVPREYVVDNMTSLNLIGTYGKDISASLNLIVCRPQLRQNILRTVSEQSQLKINGYVVRAIAEADLVLTEEEKRLGCVFVDFGAETTTVAIYKSGSLHYLSTIPLGSRNITRDITALNYLEERAEDIKKVVGCAVSDSNSRKSVNEGIDTTEINNYVQARAGEIVANIVAQLDYAECKVADVPSGIVIVGGGAKLNGFNTLLENQSKLKVRCGVPSNLIRIVKGHIQPSESVDVIAILAAVAKTDFVECVAVPVSLSTVSVISDKKQDKDVNAIETNVKNPVDDTLVVDNEDADENDDVESKSPWWKKKMKSLRGRLENVINDDEDDE